MSFLTKACFLLALAVATGQASSALGAYPPDQNAPGGQVGWPTEPTTPGGGANAARQHERHHHHHRRRRRRSLRVSGAPETKCCSPDANYAQPGPVADAVAYLRNHYGSAWNDAGSCGRVSCSYGAAVYWCNDSGSLKSMDWNDLADAVQAIADGCGRSVGICGSRVFTRGVRVIVSGDAC
ncbi:hypothetical protein GGTG_06777 [Gaeumannomyces tritici R3-111a-1]|uniref:Ecp2 effector protein domain-containing protein n=1 Tax=Gaeumannomyces tritici (strain R3-111a-1) TaxID=644352 RepID=J3NZT0_GAET3|nr:hypothetical protein GGTG_06777 [Gaeumannomyces tritici R3-111a-1]EJT76863.1 hypothetical protein GGTG_06777 [Gaeumannomyces tritici R3-111a-1]